MERFQKQIAFEPLGSKGQEVLSRSKALVVGLGGLGSHVAEMLCRMGIGGLRLVDRDYVDVTNLHRQALYTEEDADQVRPKALALRERLKSINSRVAVEGKVWHVDASNVTRLLKGVDVIIDGSDNLSLRFLLNEACVRAGKPLVFGAVAGSQGYAMAVLPGVTACLRCLLSQNTVPQPVRDTGLYPPTVRVTSALQCSLAVQALVRRKPEKAWAGRLHVLDVWSVEMEAISVARRVGSDPCPVCVRGEFEWLSAEKPTGPQVIVDDDVVNILPERKAEVDLNVIRARLQRVQHVKANEYLVWAQIGDVEMAVFRDGRMSVKGVGDWSEAVHLYERYLGE